MVYSEVFNNPSFEKCWSIVEKYKGPGRNRVMAIVAMGEAVECCTNNPQLEQCREMVQTWLKLGLDTNEVMRLYDAVDKFPDRDEALYKSLESHFKFLIYVILYYCVDDKGIMKYLLKKDPDMLLRILRSCPKGWFYEHRVCEIDEKTGEIRYIHRAGMEEAGNTELVRFIEENLEIRLKPKQKTSLADVIIIAPCLHGLKYKLPLTPEMKSQLGLTRNILGHMREDRIPSCFCTEAEKIPTKSVRGCKTPDFLVYISGYPVAIVEVYSGTSYDLEKRCRMAIKHGDSKEMGRGRLNEQYKLDEDTVTIAALVVDDQCAPDEDAMERILSRIDICRSRMDFLLILFKSPIEGCIPDVKYLWSISGRTMPDIMSPDVIRLNVAKKRCPQNRH